MQRYCALQAVEPNSETSSVAGESHCGQRTWRAVGSSVSGIGPVVEGAGPGGEMPAAASAARPAGVIQSVVQAGCRLTRTSTRSKPAPLSSRTRSSRIAAIAGQPE